MIGRVLGHYEVIEKLGQGGMGVVYKAHDTHLDRFVALKVLSADKLSDTERKVRFVKEAKSASALNHPNIVVIHDIATADGVDYIAMEYVAGHTVQQKLKGKPLSLREVLNIAVQTADGLARAHQAGIIHRDLKPANIMVDDAGLVKLLDFGLAKLTDTATGGSETKTVTDCLTSEGSVLGTPVYMSPEQAEGKRIDSRSDVFSFGLVLYEMTTGQPAFGGRSTASVVASILRDEPRQISEIVSTVPPELGRIVTRCLRKDAARRFQHMDDVKVELQEIKEEYESGKLAAVTPLSSGPKRIAPRAYLSVLGIVLAGVAGLLWSYYHDRTQQPRARGTLLTRLTSDPGLTVQPSLSPDGKLIAYSSDRAGDGGLDIWVQQLAGGEPVRLTRDPADDQDPSFSPDGSRILFSSGRQGGGVYMMSALGGAEQKIAEGGFGPRFSPDGNWIAYRTGDRLATIFGSGAIYVVPTGGGVPRRLAHQLANAFAPNGKSVLIFGVQGAFPTWGAIDWWIVQFDSGEMRQTGIMKELQSRKLAPSELSLATQHLVPFANRWTEDHIIFSAFFGQISNIWRLPFSPASRRISGPPERLTMGTALEADASILSQGTQTSLAFSSVLENVDLWSLPIQPDRAKPMGELQRLTRGLGADVRPSVTVDGSKLVYNSNAAGNWDVWIKDLQSGAERVLVSSELDEENPRISSDGQEVVYRVAQDAFTTPAAGGLKRKVVGDCSVFPWSTTGHSFVCQNARGLALLDATSGERKPIVDGTNLASRLSWDDQWVTFYRNVSGGFAQIFVAPVMSNRPARDTDLVPITGGTTWDALPEFSPDGRILYFQSERDGARCLWAQRLDGATKKPVGSAFPVQHFHKVGLSLTHVMPGQRAITVARDKIIIAAAERTGNVWLARF